MSQHPPNHRPAVVRMTLVDITVPCARCGAPIVPGTVIEATAVAPCEPLVMVHDRGCPAAWTPTLIHGDSSRPARGASAQLSLPLLAAVPELSTVTDRERNHS
jgi:hypothetical protein